MRRGSYNVANVSMVNYNVDSPSGCIPRSGARVSSNAHGPRTYGYYGAGFDALTFT